MQLNAAQQKQVLDNMGLVSHMAYTVIHRFNMFCKEDLEGPGYIGLCKAVIMFDPSFGCKFSTFACSCIYAHIITAVREDLGHKRHKHTKKVSWSDEFINKSFYLDKHQEKSPLTCELEKFIASLSKRDNLILRMRSDGKSLKEIQSSIKSITNQGVDYILKKIRKQCGKLEPSMIQS